MTERVSYAQLDSVLAQLGFHKTTDANSHVTYRHEATGTILRYPKHRQKDLVPLGSIIGTRKLLVDRGVVDSERLEGMLLAAAA
jgi:predicted RNA binding protein YcfA (HicA-like mRNA interferase family)